METLGHSQISLTMNIYSHVLPALQIAAARYIRSGENVSRHIGNSKS